MKRALASPAIIAAGVLLLSAGVAPIGTASPPPGPQSPHWLWAWRQPPHVFEGYYVLPLVLMATWGGEHLDQIYVAADALGRDDVPPGGIYRSLDGGAEWEHLGEVSDSPITDLVIHPITSTVLLVGTNNQYPPGGMLRSADGGGTWSSVLPGRIIYDIEVDPDSPHRLYAATCCWGGVYRSDDVGLSWYQISDQALQDIEAQPGSPGGLFGARYFSTNDDEGVYHSNDFGETWVQLAHFHGTSRVMVDERHPQRVFAFGDGLIYRSFDGGDSWTDISSGLPFALGAYKIVKEAMMDPGAEDTLWVGMRYTGVYVSHDAGDSWQPFNDGIWFHPAFGTDCVSLSFSGEGTPVVVCDGLFYAGAKLDHQRFLPIITR